ncbi:Uu.00g096520.m01.CDS01 [Anthostomella pinea]|uniref:Uu.00g096520.m01.CDS01 n=1 Tax=Anthostomella pinea TaxID=933095 RepID=A0AAI8VCA9_9PEZI|nr:Uu.00g096520.m01.CDS01 [Anthostomella pinea]
MQRLERPGMHRAATSTGAQNAAPFFSTNIWGSGSSSNHNTTSTSTLSPPSSRSRPGTSAGDREGSQPNTLRKERSHSRRPSFGRKVSSPSPGRNKRSASSSTTNGGGGPTVVTDAAILPALPDFALLTAAKIARDHEIVQSPGSVDSYSKMLTGRSAPTPTNGYFTTTTTTTSPPVTQSGMSIPPPESPSLYQHIQDVANKRISTLDYLRKAHEGRVYWFNTLLFDKPDLARMPYFESRKLARRATNYLLLGLSLPAVIDLNSSTPLEFLRSLNTLLAEFDSYQQIHTENGVNSSSLSRARLPQMFRRGAGGKGRRQSGAAGMDFDGSLGIAAAAAGDGSAVNSAPAGVISFGLGGEGNDLLPGEEYTHLLTPNLPFDPDFFETFATLCDVLIDCYSRLMSLLPSPRDCSPVVAELFTKADARVRKIIIQGVVKEFEDSSRAGLKQEVASVGKVVLGGLM